MKESQTQQDPHDALRALESVDNSAPATEDAAVAAASPEDHADSVASKLTRLISGIFKQTESAMEDLLPTVNEIDVTAAEIMEQIQQRRNDALERKARMEEERERFQQTASSVLEMLNATGMFSHGSGGRDETSS